MSYNFAPGSTGQSIRVMVRDSGTGQPKPGITSATSGALVQYIRDGAQATTIPLVDLAAATSPWQAGGWFEVATGLFRLDLPDAAIAAGVVNVTVEVAFSGALGDAVAIVLIPSISPVGAGSSTLTVTVRNANTTNPLANANLWVSTDLAGANVIAGTVYTSAQGQQTFYLNPGAYYVWTQIPGYNSANPYAVTVTSSATALTLSLTPATAPVAPTPVISHTDQQTVLDAQGRLLDYMGADASAQAQRDARRAIEDTLRDLSHQHQWNYFYTRGRIPINGPFTDGTVAYTHSSGLYPRMLVLTPGTSSGWPSWVAQGGTVRINNVVADVVQQIDAYTVVLDPINNFEADLPAGTAYTLYQDTYTLPEGFYSMDRTYAQISWGGMQYVHPKKWVEITRYIQTSSNTPGYYTFTGDPRNPGRLALRIFPYPDQTSTLDMLYSRAPRKVQTWDYHAGTATVSLGSPATVTGTGTAWKTAMAGTVIRFSADAVNLPDALDGDNPYVEERTVLAVNSPTSLTVDEALTSAYSGVLYRLSDPIDVELGAMYACFMRGCEAFLSTQRKLKDKPDAQRLYAAALEQAREQDARNYPGGRVAGVTPHYRQRLASMPIDFSG